MIVHLVSFTWKPDVAAEDVARVHTEIAGLADKVPCVAAFDYGDDVPGGDAHGDFGVVALIDSDDVNDYLKHPAHVHFATTYVLPYTASRAVVDFEASPQFVAALLLNHNANQTRTVL